MIITAQLTFPFYHDTHLLLISHLSLIKMNKQLPTNFLINQFEIMESEISYFVQILFSAVLLIMKTMVLPILHSFPGIHVKLDIVQFGLHRTILYLKH